MSSRALSIFRTVNKGLQLQQVRHAGGQQGLGLGIPPFPPGPRQIQQAKNWIGSGVVFGGTAFALLCYFSDWKVIVAYIPFYNGKFKEDE